MDYSPSKPQIFKASLGEMAVVGERNPRHVISVWWTWNHWKTTNRVDFGISLDAKEKGRFFRAGLPRPKPKMPTGQ